MDYITRHYKNLSEQLAAKVNYLQQILTEMEAANLQTLNVEFDATPQGDYNQADSGLQPVMAGTGTGYNPNDRRTTPGVPFGKNGKPQYGYDPSQRYIIIAPGGRYFILTGNPAVMYGPFNQEQDPSGFGWSYPVDRDLGPAYWVFDPGRGIWHQPGTSPSDQGGRWRPNRWYY